jgi:uncharacterized protein YifN (PemK superfamily)
MLPREVKSKDILKGSIFYVALPYLESRPLKFVEPDKDNKGLYKIIQKDDGFEPIINKDGKKVSPELQIVCGVKLRPCLIIQNDEMNQNEQYPLVIVLPIQTFSSNQKNKALYKRVIEKNDLPEYFYLDNGSYITIDNPRRVYKNTLFTIPNHINFDKNLINIDEIMIRLAECFEINKIRQCENCSKNCDNCEFKMAVNE